MFMCVGGKNMVTLAQCASAKIELDVINPAAPGRICQSKIQSDSIDKNFRRWSLCSDIGIYASEKIFI